MTSTNSFAQPNTKSAIITPSSHTTSVETGSLSCKSLSSSASFSYKSRGRFSFSGSSSTARRLRRAPNTHTSATSHTHHQQSASTTAPTAKASSLSSTNSYSVASQASDQQLRELLVSAKGTSSSSSRALSKSTSYSQRRALATTTTTSCSSDATPRPYNNNTHKRTAVGKAKATSVIVTKERTKRQLLTHQTATMDEERRRTTSFRDPADMEGDDSEADPLTGAMNSMFVNGKMSKVKAASGPARHELREEIQYGDLSVVGNGSFGVVFKTTMADSKGKHTVALKKVLQDRRYKNRELEIMREVLHRNVVALKWFFFTPGSKGDSYLNLVMEYMPTSLSAFADGFIDQKTQMPAFYVKISIYQMFRALAFLHGLGICHRDIKPQNLLLNVPKGILKLCDFGCAKILQTRQPNVSYICSRYYRAPELCIGASYYSHAIDVWSGACVMAELLLNKPIFRGTKSSDQMEKIMKVIGSPSKPEIKAMNPEFRRDLHIARTTSLEHLLRHRPSAERRLEIDLLTKMFAYSPSARPHSIEVLAHPFFDELRDPETMLPNGQPLPELFDFTKEELAMNPSIEKKLRP